MYALVANGYQGIVKTKRELDALIAIYPYPKFRKFYTEEDARKFIRSNTRRYDFNIREYGDTYERGFITIEYFISKQGILANCITNKAGDIYLIHEDENVIIDKRSDFLKIKVKNVELDDKLIPHHLVAIKRLLLLVGDAASVCLVVPDISIYIALTSYKGANQQILSIQNMIHKRLGTVSYTIRDRG